MAHVLERARARQAGSVIPAGSDRVLAARVRFLRERRHMSQEQVTDHLRLRGHPFLDDERTEELFDDAVHWGIPASDGEGE
jgi:hypothetical protein